MADASSALQALIFRGEKLVETSDLGEVARALKEQNDAIKKKEQEILEV